MALRPRTTRADAYEVLTHEPGNLQTQYGRIEFCLHDRYVGTEPFDPVLEAKRWEGKLVIEVNGRSPEEIDQLLKSALDKARLE